MAGDYTPQDEADEREAGEDRIRRQRLQENANYDEYEQGPRRMETSREPARGRPSLDNPAKDLLDRLALERDAEVTAGLPTSYNQQTLVGNISGAGNRHVIEDDRSPRRPMNIPNQLPDDSGTCAPTAPHTTGTWVWGSIDGVCQWIDTTECP